jgi:Tfp pilus assembly protein PilZ
MFSDHRAQLFYSIYQFSTAAIIILLFIINFVLFPRILSLCSLINLIIFCYNGKYNLYFQSAAYDNMQGRVMIKKLSLPTMTILLILFLQIIVSAPAFCYSYNSITDYTDAVRGALRSLVPINQNDPITNAVAATLLLVIIILLIQILLKSARNRTSKDSMWGQKRDWLRLPVNQYFLYARGNDNNFEKAKAVNISGGGLLFTTDKKLEQNENLQIVLNFAEDKRMDIVGQVAWISENSAENKEKLYLVGVKFGDIKASDRDGLISRILQKQRMVAVDYNRDDGGECIRCGMPIPAEDSMEYGAICPRCRTTE